MRGDGRKRPGIKMFIRVRGESFGDVSGGRSLQGELSECKRRLLEVNNLSRCDLGELVTGRFWDK